MELKYLDGQRDMIIIYYNFPLQAMANGLNLYAVIHATITAEDHFKR